MAEIILAGIAGIILLTLLLKKPLFGIYATIVAVPFVNNTLLLPFLMMIIGTYVLHGIYKKSFSFRFHPVHVPILLFLGVQVLSTVLSITPIKSLQNLSISILSICIYFIMVNTIETKEDLDKCIKVFMLIVFALSILGIYQHFTLGATNAVWVDQEVNPDLETRVIGTFGNPNIFAEYIEHMLPVTILLFFGYKSWRNKIIQAGMSLVMLACLILTFSRGGWLGFAVAAMFILAIQFIHYVPFFITVGLASIPFLPDVILQRIASTGSTSDTSNAYRILLWEGTWNMIKDLWPTGIGFGYWAYRYGYLYYAVRGTRAWHSHNLYLEIFAEMGIWGILTFILFGVILFISTIQFARKTSSNYMRNVSLGLLCGVIALMVHGVAEHILYMPKSVLTFWILIGLIVSAQKVGTLTNDH